MRVLATILTIMFCGGFAAAMPSFAAEKPELDADKVIVVMVYDRHCKKSCDDLRPRIAEIRETYGDSVGVHQIDVSKDVLPAAKDKAKQLGIEGFLPGVIDYVPCVGIFTRKRRLVKELPVSRKKDVYVRHIEKALKSG